MLTNIYFVRYSQENETCAKCEAAKEKELRRIKEEKLLANLLGRDGHKIDSTIVIDFTFTEEEVDIDGLIEDKPGGDNEKDVKELGSKVVLPDNFETENDETKKDCDLLQLMDSV